MTRAASIPITATYRLQLNAAFTLHDARELVPDLRRLGISHLYCSPVLAARRGSTHGYDVTDPTIVNAELGGDAAFAALAETVHGHGMGLVLDIVPNHMGVGADNPYWDDLLAHGQASRYASWFDVEWRATTKRLAGKVLVPVLGDTLEKVVARDELTIEPGDQGVRLRYFDHSFPLDPATLPPEPELAQRDPAARPVAAQWSAGEEGRRRLGRLLAKQHYELAFWRTAQRDLNYRRFFDVNELISLRVERAEVFEATHRTVLRFVADGLVDGLRVDHIDGLLEPRRYLERLRAALDARAPSSHVPVYVEKILAEGESLAGDWPVDGTTGYEVLTALEDLFVDPAGYAELEGQYRRAGEAGFHAIALDAKRRVLRSALNADVRRIAPMLGLVAREGGWPARSIAHHAGAIVELVAALPVYRTYMDAERPDPSPHDRAMLERAFAIVRERGVADAESVDALERVLVGEGRWHDAPPALAARRLAFVLRWQQLTGPAAAKGVEDTALYMYAPLASRNEVGGDPGVPVEGAAGRLHARLRERAARYPGSLNTTNTHDTKRSADVRARLDAISQHAGRWRRRLRHWRRHHRALRTLAGGRLAPTRTTDNFIYQSLVGIWPMQGGPSRDGAPGEDARELATLRERLTAYIEKAVREAKVRTSWTDPDTEYEAAVAQFIAGLLDRARSPDFLREMEQFVELLRPWGIWSSLSRLVVHLTAPGVPDVYQGDELWFQALVDPDNRRPVDWALRRELLGEVERGGPGAVEEWRQLPADGRLKLHVTSVLLRWRRDAAAWLASSDYRPVAANGARAGQLFAFERQGAGHRMLVVVSRLTHPHEGAPPVGDYWRDASILLEETTGARWRDLLTGTTVRAEEGAGRIALSEALGVLPVAVLVREE